MDLTGEALAEIALKAGAVIMEIYATDFDVETKGDASPVTAADEKAEAIILEGLKTIAPDIPVLAEEAVSAGDIPEIGDTFFLVDPLDGTKEFVNKRGEFTVNIALIEHGRPVMGVVFAPAMDRLFVAESVSEAWQATAKAGGTVPEASKRKPLRIRRQTGALTAVASKSHRTPETDEFLEKYDIAEIASAGSSLKFCLIAAGEADIYPRMGRTMEWDTGAGQAVVEAAGGIVLQEDGTPLRYGKTERGYDNPYFIVYGDVTPV